MRFFGKWIWFQNKRLFRRPAFLALLLAIPLFTLTVTFLSARESGFFRIQLAGGEGELSARIIEELRQEGQEDENRLLLFSLAESEEAARDAVRTGQADAAWIFPEDLEGELERFIRSGFTRPPAVTVVQREETVALRMTREKLSGTLYEPCGKVLYLSYLRAVLPKEGPGALSDEELLRFYEGSADGTADDAPLFIVETADPAGEDASDGRPGYLLSPLRGLLGVLTAAAGLAAAVFALQEERGGGSLLLPPAVRRASLLLTCLLAVGNTSLWTLAALYLSGLGGPLLTEIAALLLYGISCALLGTLLARLIPHPLPLCAGIPLFSAAMLALCPIFLDGASSAAALFPLTWYLQAFRGGGFLPLAGGTAVLAVLVLVTGAVRAAVFERGRFVSREKGPRTRA